MSPSNRTNRGPSFLDASTVDDHQIDSQVPDERIRTGNERPAVAGGSYVLYWMSAFRRIESNFAIQRAVDWAITLDKPLIVLETIECDAPWATSRRHRFVFDGMKEMAARLSATNVSYYPYLEPQRGCANELLQQLARDACLVVSDDYPCRELDRRTSDAAEQMQVRLELIDSNGLLPMRATNRVFKRAADFRRFLQASLRPHLLAFPEPTPVERPGLKRLEALPEGIALQWPRANLQSDAEFARTLATFPIDHGVGPTCVRGGMTTATRSLRDFLSDRLLAYDDDRNRVEAIGTSGLSPYLKIGHISAHQVFLEVADSVDWSPHRMADQATGSARGWWGVAEPVESFLDQLVTWRELGFNLCSHRDDYDRYESLPDWAQKTLDLHARDVRDHVYTFSQFEAAETHDLLWNAAQTELVREGRIHNYLRMLWGKKILEWTESPQHALQIMIELNNKYALDGCDPNSYSGIFWVLGRYDRAWGPERPIFGKVRYMSSANTARKMRVKGYLERYGSGGGVATAGA